MNKYQQLMRKFLGVAFIVGDRWTSGLFLVASISFMIFVVGGYMEETMFPVPVFIYLVTLAPLGWRALTEDIGNVVGETAVV